MQTSKPSTRTVAVSDVKDTVVQLLDQVSRGETRILIEENGVPVAALVSSEDLMHLARLDEQRAERRRVVAALREPFRGVSSEEIERETAKAVAEVREEMRAEREERFAVIDRMREAFADVPLEEIEREAKRTVAEARERIRQRNAELATRTA